MKNRERNQTKIYEAPYVEVYEVEVERGFVQSGDEQIEVYDMLGDEQW